MAPPQERDYIGLSPAAAAAATELRLGLPGTEDTAGDGGGAASEAPLTLELLSKGGAKRGFTGAVAEEEDEKKKAQPPAAKAQVVGWPPIRSYRKNTMATNLSAPKSKEEAEAKQAPVPGCLYVKVSMDGAPYLRKVDLKMYKNYKDLSLQLEKKFSGFTVGLHNMVCADCGLRNTIDFACEVCRNEFTWALLAYRVFLIPAGHGESTGKSGRDGLSDCRLMDLKSGTELVLTYEDKDGDWMLVGDVPWRMFTDSCRRMRIMKGSDAVGLAPRAIEKSKNQK